jgi:predicted GH43/DUF377 family glycosyl hydrolase
LLQNPGNIDIKTDKDVLKQVLKFKYLGTIFTEDGKNKYLKQRTKEAKVMFNHRKQLLSSNNLSLEVKKQPIKSCICVLLFTGQKHCPYKK